MNFLPVFPVQSSPMYAGFDDGETSRDAVMLQYLKNDYSEV